MKTILFVASECYPLIKTGGLADVVGALPLALEELGFDVRVMLPAYPTVLEKAVAIENAAEMDNLFGGHAQLLNARSENGLKLILLRADHLFDIGDNPYSFSDSPGGAEVAQRFAALSFAAAEVALGNVLSWKADVVHAHDWQAGLTAAYLSAKPKPRPATVFTIHNLAFQGLFPHSLLPSLKLPESMFTMNGLEYWDRISFMKSGIVYSDHITAVSPSYALEITTDEGGMGMGGLLRSLDGRLSGILNGVDTAAWNPESDPALVASYSVRRPAAKAKNKEALQREFGIEVDPKALLFSVVSRMTRQKGLDLLLEAVPDLVDRGAQLVLVGSGDADLEKGFIEIAERHPDQVGVSIAYDEELAHRVQGGSDAMLIPSRFEPCGLTQLCAMRYGTLPVVARVGGLADTVIDANEAALQGVVSTGFQFGPPTREMLVAAIDRVIELYSDKGIWRKMRRNAMQMDVSWTRSARKYAQIYSTLHAWD